MSWVGPLPEPVDGRHESRWFPRFRGQVGAPPGLAPGAPAPRTKLYCFAHAGAGASRYRRWVAGLAGAFDVQPVQLPGREGRRAEAPYTDLEALVHDLCDALEQDLDRAPDRPFAFFGHSYGGVVAYELSRELRRRHELLPDLLALSATPAPDLPLAREPLHGRSDDALLAHLEAMSGTPAALFEHSWLLQLYLPVLRADLTAFETRAHRRDTPLECPVLVLGGEADPFVDVARLAQWRREAGGPFRLVTLPGHHHYLDAQRAAVWAALHHASTEAGLAVPAIRPRAALAHPSGA